MTDLGKGRPEFAASMRGYDRLQVDDYVERLHALLDEAEERARTAEARPDGGGHATVGPRVAQIFALAVEEGDEIRERAGADAHEELVQAHLQAQQIVAASREEAANAAAQAAREREHVMADADAYLERAHAEVLELQRKKARLLAELRRVHEALANVAGLVQDGEEDRTLELDVAGDMAQPAALAAGAHNGAARTA